MRCTELVVWRHNSFAFKTLVTARGWWSLLKSLGINRWITVKLILRTVEINVLIIGIYLSA